METGRYFEYALAALIFYIIITVVYSFLSGKSEGKSKDESSTKRPVQRVGLSDINIMSFGDSVIGFRAYKKPGRK